MAKKVLFDREAKDSLLRGVEIVGTAQRRFVRVQIKIPAAGGDGVVEAPRRQIPQPQPVLRL